MEQSSLPTGMPQNSPEVPTAVNTAAATGVGEFSAAPERVSAGEQHIAPGGGLQQAQSAQPIAPPPQVQAVTQTQTPTDDGSDDNPLVADDVDVIEKEWIDRAKQIVTETRDDPHAQERKVSELQSDYLKKRYGKDVKPTSD